MEMTDYGRLVQNVFRGVPLNRDGKKVQSLMYYIFDIGRLGLDDGKSSPDLIKCFKNEISGIMKGICNAFSEEKVEDFDEAANLFFMMTEKLMNELRELCQYMFGDQDKVAYFTRRIQQNVDKLILQVRAGELVI
jgi:hypothetical protein